MLTVGSLFAGIGGFDLGFERAGMRTLWQVEQSEFCRRVLERHFPDAHRFNDVREVTGSPERWAELGGTLLEYVDVLCGGFPCQDLSYAGKGAGIDGERSGLWTEFARLIGELRPRYVVVENVPAVLRRGVGRVIGDLAALGYGWEYDCLPAAAFGAPHIRDRWWLVAYPDTDRGRLQVRPQLDGEPLEDPTDWHSCRRHVDGLRHEVADATCEGRTARGIIGARPALPEPERRGEGGGWSWAAEPDIRRVAHGVSGRVDRLAALGNALCPPIAQWIGERIIEAEGGIAA